MSEQRVSEERSMGKEQLHTPGPWFTSYDKGSSRDIMSKDAVIGTVRIAYVTQEQYKANALLIRAAPDLLALAYQYARECAECNGIGVVIDGGDCEGCRHVRKVIERATQGDSHDR